MDWFELLLVIIGAVLGFLLSILTMIIQKVIDKQGKMRIFSKISIDQTTQIEAGYSNRVGRRKLFMPIIVELQNTSNTSRIIRDLCLYLYKDNKSVGKMLPYISTKNDKGEDIKYGDDGSYSFVVPALCINEYYLFYSIEAGELIDFSTIKVCYYDESNNMISAVLIDNINGNDENLLIKCQYEYKLLKFKKNRKSK